MSFDSACQLPHKKAKMNKSLKANEFTAPEVFLGKYDKKIDEYSVGILMFYLLSG